MGDVTWLTQDAYDRLQEELAERSGPRRAEIVKRIELAREEGDLKENSGYHAAKDEQGHNEARIKQLQHTLDHAQIGTPDSAHDEAAHGKVVTVRFPALDMDETFLLASREEAAHASIEVYSPTSPLGAAIDGKKVGETASYTLPNGNSMDVEIVAVTDYTP
ncbi:MAG: transcription elongation factor GreA [Candidatus Nanopelagicales bacterium]